MEGERSLPFIRFLVHLSPSSSFLSPLSFFALSQALSRAFRNRFLELHFSDIPTEELATIINERCALPLKWANVLVEVMKGFSSTLLLSFFPPSLMTDLLTPPQIFVHTVRPPQSSRAKMASSLFAIYSAGLIAIPPRRWKWREKALCFSENG